MRHRLFNMTSQHPGASRRQRRGSVVLIVVWAIAVAGLVASAVQLTAMRQANIGNETLAKVQARWAARAGIERSIAVMNYYTERNPVPHDALAMYRDLDYVADGELDGVRYEIMNHLDERRNWGPIDEHSKLNINSPNFRQWIINIPDMTIDVMEAMEDWRDVDTTPRSQGAESDYYANRAFPYEPRNENFRSVLELELVAGIWPQTLRGEDWNLNGRLDPNEDDGDASWPFDDDGDGILNPGWSGYFTAYSVAGSPTASGEPRLRLRDTDPKELEQRLGIDKEQAEALVLFGQRETNQLTDLLFNELERMNPSGQFGPQVVNPALKPLSKDQLRKVFWETAIGDPAVRYPGKLNINTASASLLREVFFYNASLADDILFLRQNKAEGLSSPVDFLDLPSADQATLQQFIIPLFDTSSNVFTINSRGRSLVTGLEVEIICVVDRSTLPVTILEYREQ